MKGQKLNVKLVPYNTKLEPETKQQLDALAQVRGLSQRELLGDLLDVYGKARPEVAERAQQLLGMLGGPENV